MYHIHGVKWLDLEFYGFFLILIDVATRKILATNKKLWFLPVVWWSLRFFNKCRKPIIKCWSIPVPVHKTGNVLKGSKITWHTGRAAFFFSLNKICWYLSQQRKVLFNLFSLTFSLGLKNILANPTNDYKIFLAFRR